MEGDKYYILAVRQAAGASAAMTFSTAVLWDYTGMMKWTKMQGMPQYAAVLDVNNSGHYVLTGDEVQKRVPNIQLSILDNAIVSNKQVRLPESSLTVSPNPSLGAPQISINWLGSGADAELRLLDVSGRLMWQRSLTAGSSLPLTLQSEDLPAGVYVLHLSTPQGALSKKIVLQPKP